MSDQAAHTDRGPSLRALYFDGLHLVLSAPPTSRFYCRILTNVTLDFLAMSIFSTPGDTREVSRSRILRSSAFSRGVSLGSRDCFAFSSAFMPEYYSNGAQFGSSGPMGRREALLTPSSVLARTIDSSSACSSEVSWPSVRFSASWSYRSWVSVSA